MDLSIIILNYKTKGLARQCLKSIALAKPELEYEIIVVDNNSADDISKMLEQDFPQVKYIQSPDNVGFAAGNNLGIKESRGRYFLILNPDITVMPGSLEKMMRFMDQNPKVGLVAPQLLNPDKSVQYSCYQFPTLGVPIYRRTPLGKFAHGKKVLKQYLMSDWNHADTREVDWCLGACLMARRETVEQVGMLDQRYFMYFEDADWCRRFWQAGFKVVYFPEVKVIHYHIRQSADVPWFMGLFQKISRIHMASALKYFWKFRGKGNPRVGGAVERSSGS
ncbi:glycosyltransferase family 2 protein [Patescibacteria group bacterium]|nr:glycosyltransferase family 2 protein [Patescibacteria group bacterium]MBU1922498.1 glycosyltransferase family 2 protein [Patescibacteria group bacterium]